MIEKPKAVDHNHIQLRKWTISLISLSVLWFVPSAWCKKDLDSWQSGPLLLSLAKGVAESITHPLPAAQFAMDTKPFNKELRYQMAVIGLSQTLIQQPEAYDALAPALELAVQEMLSEINMASDLYAWGESPLESTQGHAGWLGYTSFALGCYQLAMKNETYNAQQHEMILTLADHFEASLPVLVETYPGERYFVDNAAGLGALALYDLATGADHHALIEEGVSAMKTLHVSGMITQSVSETGQALGETLSSQTFLASVLLAPVNREFSELLFSAGKHQRFLSLAGFGMMHEYRRESQSRNNVDFKFVMEDIPASVFALGAARIHGDTQTFSSLIATMTLIGAPIQQGESIHFITSSPFYDTILLAMLSGESHGKTHH